ncbi:MAG: GNAT family N-acetyltransferase [Firmicutes bacterium]|nr:GNAT family N-acetyltransferase [Bacillota bacterium]
MLKKIDRENFAEVYAIMEKSFPKDERRSYEAQEALFEKKEYCIYGEKTGDKISGFIAVWEFEEFSYIEHFAVDEVHRNSGRGKAMLSELLEISGKPVVLEVEPPENKDAKRRIGFYERNGFFLNEYHYVQLPLEEGREEVELKIMSYPEAVSEEGFYKVKDTIYKSVFGVKK